MTPVTSASTSLFLALKPLPFSLYDDTTTPQKLDGRGRLYA
jgi:hypothetical protein